MTYSNERSRVLGCLALALFVTGMFALVSTCLFPGPYTSALPRPFSSDQWKAAGTWSDTRCSMLADLTYRIGVVGKTQSELYRLLGKPQHDDGDPTSSHWELCPSFADVFILEVRWRDGRAVSAQVRDT